MRPRCRLFSTWVFLATTLSASGLRRRSNLPAFLLALLVSFPTCLAGQGMATVDAFNRSNTRSFVQPVSPLIEKELRLGGDYLVGRGVQRDPVQSAYWYRQAAEQGDPDAQNQLGYFCMWGIGVARDPAQAFRWFARSAGAGSQAGKLNLAVMYFRGVGTPRDLALAVDLMTQLAEKGNARAQGYLGILYLTGDGAPRDPARAEKWLTKAAKAKNPEAEYTMGVLWSSSPGHQHNAARAAKYFRTASHQGYVPAMHALGLLLEQHAKIPVHAPDEAVTMLENAARSGSWASSAALGALARDGHNRPQNFADAFRWFTIAARQGGAEARSLTRVDLDRCRQVLSEDQQNQELETANVWLAQHPNIDLYSFSGSMSSDFPVAEVYAPGPTGQ